ncbi:MAG: DNA primase [Thaumarchaeota archaeon 13_1_40CM_38_12]|nr:MAG: DNA primase [Thaumarchaeota archaeon 13_1_40CM_38_12]OLC34056.1 MAG: DNA primase [Thaumarchaeota archaeon 13_1_40CM_4_38_7]OLC93187.1 MAG: DNA primase [Thaumarchaeota archaeon 13_1_40CM_3_38_6]OLD41695.1 MAG: DNA primase [Thaumarchaeota archaeon 13_1_40CM_2_39_4]TLY03213.1 MAG: DNA primase [Nitrososphaerota archaeon]
MPYSGIVKYHVKLSFDVDGLVEKADIIGAIFGQTEGLLGPEMNLNELQKVSKVGRIEVNTTTTTNQTKGDALLPMSTDINTAALIAAAIESIDKVGPFQATFKLEAIEDVRTAKKKEIVDRAREIVQKWSTKTISEGDEMLKDVSEVTSAGKLTTFGKEKLACGSGVFDSPWIILVEGRADVINLLRAGFENALAIEGAKIDESIKSLCESKSKVVAFLDGDRAGGFILKELKSMVRIDVVHRAPEGVEVEELTPMQIVEILKDTAVDMKKETAKPKLQDPSDEPLANVAKKVYPELNESLEAVALDEGLNEVFKVPVSEVVGKLSPGSGIKYLVLDGIITQRLIDSAKQAGIECVMGHRMANLKSTDGLILKTFTELGIA